MPPPKNSLPHAPLVFTVPTLPPPNDSTQLAARTESVFASIAARMFVRPGYIPTVSGAIANDPTRDLVVVFANGLGIGGLDNLVAWPVTYDNPSDELSLLFDKALTDDIAGLTGVIASWMAALIPEDKPILAYASVGIAMTHLEDDPAITGDSLIAHVVADLNAMRVYNGVTNADGTFSITRRGGEELAKRIFRLPRHRMWAHACA
jgi:hypothetical protein